MVRQGQNLRYLDIDEVVDVVHADQSDLACYIVLGSLLKCGLLAEFYMHGLF